MSSYEYIKGRGKRFTSDNQPPNRGRKPKLYTVLKDAYGLSYEEYKRAQLYVMQLSKAEAEELSRDASTPMFVVELCRLHLRGASVGDARALSEAKADLWGKEIAAQKLDITTNGKEIGSGGACPLSMEEARRMVAHMEGREE